MFSASYAPLGYKKDSEQHGHLIVDEETAWIVRKIFAWAKDGWGAQFHDQDDKAAGWNAVGIKGLFRICSSADRYHHPERVADLHGHGNGQQRAHGKQDGHGDPGGVFRTEIHQMRERKGNLRRGA